MIKYCCICGLAMFVIGPEGEPVCIQCFIEMEDISSLAMCKTFTMRKKESGQWLFFEENEEKQRVYYTLTNRFGDTIRRGGMSLSLSTFIEAMGHIGFEEADLIA